MKSPVLIALLAITTASSLSAQDNLSDRWKETQRLDLKKKPVTYTDTLRLSDVTKESMNLRKGAFQYKGSISNDLLDFGYLTFGIVKNNKDEIQLRDEDNIHIFSRELKDNSAADAAVKKAGIDLPATPVAKIDPDLLKGSWTVYKRNNRKGPQDKVDYKTQIRSLAYELQKPEDYYGTISGGSAGAPLYSIKDTKGSDLIVDDKDKKEHLIKVWRLSAEELVLEDENGIIYYMKHFE